MVNRLNPASIPKWLKTACEHIGRLNHIRVDGLMTIGPFTDKTAPVVKSFASLRRLYEHLAKFTSAKIGMTVLSMGMSDDLEIAIQEGSNLLRIGTALFGSRNRI